MYELQYLFNTLNLATWLQTNNIHNLRDYSDEILHVLYDVNVFQLVHVYIIAGCSKMNGY